MQRSTTLSPFVLSLALTLPAALLPAVVAAQTEGDIDLIRNQNSAPPNVMILFDTSEHMRHVSFSNEFDATRFYNTESVAKSCGLKVGGVPSSGGHCPANPGTGDCPNNNGSQRGQGYLIAGDTISCKKSDFPAGCAVWPIGACSISASSITFRLPNYADAPYTARWSENYLSFLVEYMSANGTLPPDMPTRTRLQDARQAINDLVDVINPTRSDGSVADTVRFGLARFDTRFADPSDEPKPLVPNPDTDVFDGGGSDRGQGAYVVVPIGANNKAAIASALAAFDPIDFNPLGTALVDMGRYFVGAFANGTDGSVGLGAYPRYARSIVDGRLDTVSAPGSPIVTSADCQKNFVLVVTSGTPDKGDKESNDGVDFSASSSFNSTFGSDYANDGGGPASDPQFVTDVAQYLFEKDLISDAAIPGVQNLITYTVGFTVDSPTLERAATKGGGLYFTTGSTDDLVDKLRIAIDDIILRSATFTSATVPTSRQSFADAFFVTFLEPRPEGTLWVGHLQAFQLDENFNVLDKDGNSALDANGLFLEPRNPFWDTQTKLHAPGVTRNLITTKTPRTFSKANIAAADLGITASDLDDFPNDPATPFTNIETLADTVVDWVYGADSFDRDRDGNATELREAVLGDIFHSNPLAISAPPPFLAGEPGFGPIGDPTSFVETYFDRDRVLYAGANDGMLHGVHAGVLKLGDNPATAAIETAYYSINDGLEGNELFGYIPGFLLPKIKQLPQLIQKPFYVDGTPAAADAWIPSSATDTTKEAGEWLTALVVGMRNGGDGYLALDVTDPSATTGTHGPYPKLLWEFTDTDLGRTWSEPIITRVKLKPGVNGDFCGVDNDEGADGIFTSGDCREQWVAIFAGGYREDGNPNHPTYLSPASSGFSAKSRSIYIVNLEDGSVLAKASYDAADPELQNMVYSLPSQPAVIDYDFDGFADLIYVGDLGGQMWKWDISALGIPSGAASQVPLSNWPIGRVFTAPVASNGHHRNIFFPPSVTLVGSDDVRLAFGTGERTDLEYASTPGVDENRFYVLTDQNPVGTNRFLGAPFSESDLTNVTDQQQDPDLTDLGFFLVAGDDEKFVTDHVIFGGFVITTSYVPDLGAAVVLCTARGNATLYLFSVADGSGFYGFDPAAPNESRRLSIGGGLPTSPSVVTSNLAGTRVVVQTSDGRVLTPDGPQTSTEGAQIIFWREVF